MPDDRPGPNPGADDSQAARERAREPAVEPATDARPDARPDRSAHRTAQCACGQARITLAGDPVMHAVCHCTNCKRRTGSAFGISVYFDKTQVLAQRGDTAVYAFDHAAQSHHQRRHFCPACGTTLFWYVSALPAWIGVAGGCFADGGLPEPGFSVTHQKIESWLSLPTGWKIQRD